MTFLHSWHFFSLYYGLTGFGRQNAGGLTLSDRIILFIKCSRCPKNIRHFVGFGASVKYTYIYNLRARAKFLISTNILGSPVESIRRILLGSAEQFQCRALNWYWHSEVANCAPRVASWMISGSLVQKLLTFRRARWEPITALPGIIKFIESRNFRAFLHIRAGSRRTGDSGFTPL